MMLVPCNGMTVALGSEEPPIPLEGGFGRAPKHNAEKLCAVGFAARTSGNEPERCCDVGRMSIHAADCPGLRPGGRWPRIICAMFKCPPQRAARSTFADC